MRSVIRLVVLLAMGSWLAFATHQGWGFPAAAKKTGAACAACHDNPAGGTALTDAGKAYAKKPDTALPKDAPRAEYVGVNKCRACHYKQYKAWQETKHARALEGLEKGSPAQVAAMSKALGIELKAAPAKTDACVTCHVTGMGLAGGYPAADSAKTASLVHVTCESCHGPGSLHLTAKMDMRKRTIHRSGSEKMCTQCHTPATSPKFDFETYKATGVHSIPTVPK